MIHDNDVHELIEFQGVNGSVLTLYFDTSPQRRAAENYKSALRKLLTSVEEFANPADIQRIQNYFDFEHSWHGRGVACFSDQADQFWRVFPLFVPIEDSVFVSPRPYVKPLSTLLDNYARHGVAVVNQEGARLFTFFMGMLEETDGILGEEIRRGKGGGRSAARYQRAENEKSARNMKEAAAEATHFFENANCKQLILAGTDENITSFRSHLPHAWQERVLGTFHVDTGASPEEIGEHALVMAQQAAKAREHDLVEQLVTTASKNGPAVIGLTDTVAALQEGRVHQLVMVEGFEASAHRCKNCGYISLAKADVCSFCGGHMQFEPDVINTIVRRTLEAGSEVVVLAENGAPSKSLQHMNKIGAQLRY